MTKVLHYIRHMGLGGTDKTCQLFASHLSDRFEVLVAHDINGDTTRRSEFEKGLRMHDRELVTVDGDIKPIINNFKPDIIHVYRSGFPEFPNPGIDFHPIPCMKFVETNVFGIVDNDSLIDKSLFMSEWLMKYAIRRHGWTHPRFDFVNNPVEEPYTNDCFSIAKEWREEGAVILGRCGRPDNGIYHAINTNAARLLRAAGHDVRFIVMAPPPNMIKDLEDWDIPHYIVPPTPDPLALSMFYNSVDIYAHARADGETFGVNIAEAMMHGLPVVTHVAEPSVPGMGVFQSQTTLVDHASTGIVVQNNVGAYFEALVTLMDPIMREHMGAAGFVKAAREYHVDVCVNKLEKIYDDLVY